MDAEERIARAAYLTKVVRAPKQHLATFGSSRLDYYIVTEPAYKEWSPDEDESVIRHGTITSNLPTLATPHYMLNLDGFSEDAYRYMATLAQRYGPNSPGILYQYKNEPGKLDIVSGKVQDVADRVAGDLSTTKQDSAVVITGLDELWDVSLLKFIYEYTGRSAISNAQEMEAMGLLKPVPDLDLPRGVVDRIEEMFQQVKQGLDPSVLHKELLRWGVFKAYETRFYGLFGR
ncbi:hypothetical protein ACFLX9_03090 [Chloroflexota bacterium]